MATIGLQPSGAVVIKDGKVSCTCCCKCSIVTKVTSATYTLASDWPPIEYNGYLLVFRLYACSRDGLRIDGGEDCSMFEMYGQCDFIPFDFGAATILTGKTSGELSSAVAGVAGTTPFFGNSNYLGGIAFNGFVQFAVVFPSLPPADADGNYRFVLTIPLPYDPACVNSAIVLLPSLEVLNG